MATNELIHHGIKGQKWGVRRTEAQLARGRGIVSTEKRKRPIGTKSEDPTKFKKPIGTIEENPQRNKKLPGTAKFTKQNPESKRFNTKRQQKLLSSMEEAFRVAAEHSTQVDSFIHQQRIQQMQFQEIQRIAIQDANRAASLGLTGGTNPFVFG